MRRLNAVLSGSRDERGFTLIELLVASGMGVVLMGAVVSLVIGAVKYQPRITEKAEKVSTARWVLERMTRELRNGERIESGTAAKVVFIAYERHSPCGSTTMLAAGQSSIRCRITYNCTTSSCSRIEAPPTSPAGSGVSRKIFTGINSNQVFSYPQGLSLAETTYVKVTFHVPDPQGTGSLTVSDGASLRNATLSY
jgi:type II secretory pathway pseudopilin PulG